MRVIPFLAAAALVLAGCAAEAPQDTVVDDLPPVELGSRLQVTVADVMTFSESVVTAAVGYAADLYEPTMEVSDTGVIYVTGHTIGADTTGAPVFMSKDNGASWSQLPFAGPAKMPHPIHGATPPPSDEIFLVAGDNGQLWGVDITLLTFPINGWCGDGAELCYHNPDAYDVAQAQTSRVDAASGENSACSLLNLNDRPWVDYANNKLLLVNNPGGGPVQVGLMDVPPALPVGGPGLGLVGPVAAQWNLCAGSGGGSIPGIPGMRDDHFFAVPQVQGEELVVVIGHGDVHDVEQVVVFPNTSTGGGTINGGHVVFDQDGTLFVGMRNNTRPDDSDKRTGQLHIAVSTDNGTTFIDRTFVVGTPTTNFYLDGNMAGPGALVSWAQEGDSGTDYYVAHLFVGPDGGPVMENVSLVIDEGPFPSAHVQGAAAGPDGRAYIVVFHGGYGPTDMANPLHVWIQQEGATLPMSQMVAIDAMA